ncbi:MAG TPA: ABC transporter ATP-binding protein [Baekduia sp.]|nr:ABC transporter ATP-binding protein [Baekduia sp.]
MATRVPGTLTTTPAPPPEIRAVPDAAPVVAVSGLTRSFGDRVVLDGIDLTIAPGEIVALLGASGSGKSTIIRALAGLDPDATGSASVPVERTVVFQDHRLLPWKRVWRNVVVGLRRAASRRDEALAALDEVGVAARADAWPATLSGGEAQRVAIARAFVRRPRLLLLDEPFGALDALTRLRAQALLATLCARHRPAVLLVTHDVEEALLLADRALVLVDGRITRELRVDLPRPRRRTAGAFTDLRGELLGHLGIDDAGA